MSRKLVVNVLICSLLCVLFGSQAWGLGQQSFRVRLGIFEPQGESDYWLDKELDFTGQASNFEDTVIGIDYVASLSPLLSIIVSTDLLPGRVWAGLSRLRVSRRRRHFSRYLPRRNSFDGRTAV